MTEQQIINDYSKAVNELIFRNTATETACTVMQKYVANRFSEIKLTDLKHIAQAIQIMPDETRQALEKLIIEKLGTGGLFALKRTERKLSCLELAEQLGIARNFIVRFENECHPQFSRPRSVEQVIKMADFLEIPSKNLVFREGGLYYIENGTCANQQNRPTDTEGE